MSEQGDVGTCGWLEKHARMALRMSRRDSLRVAKRITNPEKQS